MMVNRRFVRVAGATVVFTLLAAVPSTKPALNDAEIAHIAVTANQIDIDAARYALERASNAQVREFAETMIRDHTAVIEQAVALATRLGVTPVNNQVSQDLVADAEAAHEALRQAPDAQFDRAYMDREVGYHEAVISAVRTVLIPGARSTDLKTLLEGVAPALDAHLTHAKAVHAALERD